MALKQNNLIGLVLIIVGGLALLGNVGILGGIPELLFSVAMGAAGVYLIRYHLSKRSQFWASVVGFALLGLAFAALSGRWDGFYFLGLLGGGFATTYLIERKNGGQRKHWWAVIPAGVLWTLASIVALENLFPRWDESTFFFAGLAATFGYLFAYEQKRWAIFPAAILLGVGVLSLSSTGGWVFPALLIAAGVYAMKRPAKEEKVMPATPSMVTATVDKSANSEPITNETLARKLEEVSPVKNTTPSNENSDKQN